MAIKNYDPNIHQGIHTVRVTIQRWGYVGHITLMVHGSCKGRDVLVYPDFDFEDATGLENDCCLQYDEQCRFFSATLRDRDGNELEVDGEAEDFNNMVVAVEITDFYGRRDEMQKITEREYCSIIGAACPYDHGCDVCRLFCDYMEALEKSLAIAMPENPGE